MKKNLFYVLALSITMTACSTIDETLRTEKELEDAALRVGFIPITEMYNLADTINANGFFKAKEKDKDLKLFVFELGRKKYGCTKGFGVCTIKLFGITLLDKVAQLEAEKAKREANLNNCYPIQKKDGKQYVELLFSNNPITEGLTEVPDFKIDEDIEAINEMEDQNILLKVSAGSYRYDGRQGDCGGFYYSNTRHNGMILS